MAAADFIQPPLALFTDARLTDGDRTVYCLLTSFGDYGTLANCKPSVASIAKRGGRSRRAVVENLKHLDATGWIVRAGRVDEHGDKDTTLYSFPFHRVVIETALPGAPNRPTVVTETALRVVTQTALGVVTETAHNLEPFTKSQEPRTLAPVKPTPNDEQLSLTMPKSKPAKQAPVGLTVVALWNELLVTNERNMTARMDPRNVRMLNSIAERHTEPELRALFIAAQKNDYYSGRSTYGARSIGSIIGAKWEKFVKDVSHAPVTKAKNTFSADVPEGFFDDLTF